ncbi:MAG: pit accessory protein [Chthoniobacteraceae bacterium]|nr:pit accessory protein [Chthoniobacteraceae bacterium]MDB6172896.1 pit accessory protein [Chthoniobacteraceae bacterium]
MFSLQRFFSKEDQFLDLLEASAQECRSSVESLHKILQPEAKLTLEEFAASRRKGKQITNEIAELLCRTAITGLEREDIEALANSLYKIPKTVEKFAERFILFAPRLSDLKWKQHLAILETATGIVLTMVQELRAKSHLEKTKTQNDLLQKAEGEADELMLASFGELCNQTQDPVKIVIVKDLYELLEKAVDRCRDTGNVISNIVLKNS